MDDTEVDPDCRSMPSSDGDCWLLYAEADVPAKRILQQSAAGDATPTGFGGRQGTRPPESHSPDQKDCDLAPAAIRTDDSKVGRLRHVNRQTSGPMLEPGGT
jgi:hypothetical protein